MDEKELVENYIELRDMVEMKEKKFKTWAAEKKTLMRQIEGTLMAKLDQMGAQSVRTAAGTFSRVTKRNLSTADGTIFFNWCVDKGLPEMLEKRASKLAVLEWADEHGVLPPGLNLSSELTVQIRRS